MQINEFNIQPVEPTDEISIRQKKQLERQVLADKLENEKAAQLLAEQIEKEKMEAEAKKIIQQMVQKNPDISPRSLKFAKQQAMIQIQELRRQHAPEQSKSNTFQCQ